MKSMAVKAKINFNTEQRLLSKRQNILPGTGTRGSLDISSLFSFDGL